MKLSLQFAKNPSDVERDTVVTELSNCIENKIVHIC